VLSILLPRLASGWKLQRGHVFGFGDSDTQSQFAIANMDQAKLKAAPINNLDAERAVGSINYELSIRGKTELKSASSCHVKGRSSDLLEGQIAGPEIRKMYRERQIPAILQAWEERQSELTKVSLEAKELTNLNVDKRRISDLQKLKGFGGPFTEEKEVSQFCNSALPDSEKVDRLYLEVRYARDTSLSVPKSSEIFRLKKGYKKLDYETLGKNLGVFLSKLVCNKSVTLKDFDDALSKLSESS
jgi:hypothetical protein